MNHLHRTGFLLAAATLLLVTAGCSRQAEPNPPATASVSRRIAAASSPPGEVWRSVTTGKLYRAEVDQSVFKAEWVNVPAEFAKQGASIRSEARREGTKWVGSSQGYLPCSSGQGAQEHIANWCRVQTQFEIDFVGADRILGRGEALKRFDCAKCQVLAKEWKDFVWVPANLPPGPPPSSSARQAAPAQPPTH